MLNLLIDSLRHYANERHHDVKKGSYDVTYAAKLLNTYTQSMLNGLALIGQYQQLRQAIEQECRSLHAHLGNGLTPPAFTTPMLWTRKSDDLQTSSQTDLDTRIHLTRPRTPIRLSINSSNLAKQAATFARTTFVDTRNKITVHK
ncbi:hypothetical protein LDJ79_00490 [Vibrio tritonius]|uniref:Uncharacterized protein n=1 Tax=Vibrio tritonius TaxID=1435069 RepID=A0ABS7YFX4_9VIBR|nr:hypothetical protein [Vibrio tritonius]MCA2014566.1 hypothetical protein [Vibrio tritonius]